MRRRLAAAAILMLVAGACSGGSDEGRGIRVIVDYNPTQSDVGALLYVLTQEDIEVEAISIPGSGESRCERAVATTLGILETLDRTDIPVACGSASPMTGDNAYPEAWRDAADAMAGLDVPVVDGGDLDGAVDLLRDVIVDADEPVTLLTLGPLTNVGELISGHPEVVSNLAHVYVMGGAVHVDGNVFDNPDAEWNIWVDPHAAGILVESGAAVTLIPLDATNDVPVDPAVYSALFQPDAGPALRMMRGMASAQPEWHQSGGFYLWDELAAGVMVDTSYVTLVNERIAVDADGTTRVDPDGNVVRVAVAADRVRFTNDLVGAWAGSPIAVFEPADAAMEAYAAALQEAADGHRTAQDAALSAGIERYPDFSFEEQNSLDTAKGFMLSVAPHFAAATRAYVESLAEIDVPAGLDEHAAYVTALEGIEALALELETEMAAATTFAEFDAILSDPRFEAPNTACRDLQNVLRSHGLAIDLKC